MTAAMFAGGLVSAFVPTVQTAITIFTGYNHPHSYQARVHTRNASYWFYAKRTTTNFDIWRKAHNSNTWALASSIATGLSGAVQGDMGSIQVGSTGRLHAVYFISTGTYNIGWRYSDDNGSTWSSESSVATGALWGDATVSGPSLHVDASDNLHVAYTDEASAYPYYAYWNGSTWTTGRVVANGNTAQLRPNVITLTSGRVIYSFCNSSNQVSVYYSDNNGTSWTAGSPTTTGATSVSNISMIGDGNTFYVSCQEIDATRTMLSISCDGSTMTYDSAWDVVFSGDGADATQFIDSTGNLNMVYRKYPDGNPDVVYHARKNGTWTETQIGPSVDHILPKVFWQEFHRFNPTYNKPGVIMSEVAGDIDFRFITSLNMKAA